MDTYTWHHGPTVGTVCENTVRWPSATWWPTWFSEPESPGEFHVEEIGTLNGKALNLKVQARRFYNNTLWESLNPVEDRVEAAVAELMKPRVTIQDRL